MAKCTIMSRRETLFLLREIRANSKHGNFEVSEGRKQVQQRPTIWVGKAWDTHGKVWAGAFDGNSRKWDGQGIKLAAETTVANVQHRELVSQPHQANDRHFKRSGAKSKWLRGSASRRRNAQLGVIPMPKCKVRAASRVVHGRATVETGTDLI